MEISETLALYAFGNPTGYSFIYTSKQNTTSVSNKASRASFNRLKEGTVNPEVQLLKTILAVLCTLNSKTISRYKYDIRGIARMENGTTDLLLCKHPGASDWSLLTSDNGIALIDRPDIATVSVSDAVFGTTGSAGNNANSGLVLEFGVRDNGTGTEENYRCITLGTLQDYIKDTGNLLADFAGTMNADLIATTMETLQTIEELTFYTFEARGVEDPEKKEELYTTLENEAKALLQATEELIPES